MFIIIYVLFNGGRSEHKLNVGEGVGLGFERKLEVEGLGLEG